MGDTYLFSLMDSKINRAKWIEAGSNSNGFSITSYEPETKTIDYEWNGRKGRLRLINADDKSIPLKFVVAADNVPETVQAGKNSSNSSRIRTLGSGLSPNPLLTNSKSSLTKRNTIQKVIFEPIATGSGYVASGRRTSIENEYVSDDRFAQPDVPSTLNPSGSVAQADSNNSRYKVKRRNTVHNPSGKIPSHLSREQFAQLARQNEEILGKR
ncbi:MAG: hypothetical protein ACPGO0_05890 [Acidimicrobiales bacterium]